MESSFVEPKLWSFLLQLVLFTIYIPVTYGADVLRGELKREQVKKSLRQLDRAGQKPGSKDNQKDREDHEYGFRDFFFPLFAAWALTGVSYAMTHPYGIQLGLTAGIFEDVINIFGADHAFPRLILAGRFVFWGWLGAWLYSFHLTVRRFLAYDLTPNVYVFTANRFLLAIAVGAIVGIGLGTFSTAAGVPFDVNMATVSIVAFFIGFFPEQGINWISAIAKKALKQQGGIAKETHLSEIEGLSIWHQGRLKQEDIENVQNLAAAEVRALVKRTPFTVNQIVDWVDQAILLVYARQQQVDAPEKDQFAALERVGLRCASDVLTATGDDHLDELASATGLDKDGLKMLRLALQSAPNIAIVSCFRWQSSLDETKRKEAGDVQDILASTVPTLMVVRPEQETVLTEQ